MSPILWEIAPGDDRGILVIRLAPDHAAIVEARARALGLTPETFVSRWVAEHLERSRAARGEAGSVRLALLVAVITGVLAVAVTRGPIIEIRREELAQLLEAYRIEVAELCAAGAMSRPACAEHRLVWHELQYGRAVPVSTLEELAAADGSQPGRERLRAVLEGLVEVWPRPRPPAPGKEKTP